MILKPYIVNIKMKYKEEIKGALFASGIWVIVINFVPRIGEVYRDYTASIPLALLAIFVGVFWK